MNYNKWKYRILWWMHKYDEEVASFMLFIGATAIVVFIMLWR